MEKEPCVPSFKEIWAGMVKVPYWSHKDLPCYIIYVYTSISIALKPYPGILDRGISTIESLPINLAYDRQHLL